MEKNENVSQHEPTCNAIENSGMDSPDIRVLEKIEAEIREYLGTSNESYLEIGRLLLKAKGQFGKKYGDWLKWLQDHVDFSVCKAQRLMRVAKWMEGNEAPVPHLDFTKAYILSRLTKEDLDSFVKDKQIENMSKRELELAVRNHLKSRIQNRKSSNDQASQKTETSASVENDLSARFKRIESEVSELASIVDSDFEMRDTFAAELCELCESIVQQLAPTDVGDE